MPYEYDMLIARIEPENNIKMIIDAFVSSNVTRKLLVVGNMNTRLGKEIKSSVNDPRVIFLGYVADIDKLNNLRYYSNLYFHGHMVGGTNPSLLEAMASSALVCAHKNIFNSSILEEDTFYFTNLEQLIFAIDNYQKSDYQHLCLNNLDKIHSTYHWDKIIYDYEQLLTAF
jgi:glycosyltransferase involved in cell wall biosynthesis